MTVRCVRRGATPSSRHMNRLETAPASERLYNIILKVTNHCTLRCSYCYVRPHFEQENRAEMSISLWEKILREYMELARGGRGSGTDHRTIKVTWHGGEPLCAGLPYFRQVVQLQERLVSPPYRVVNAITTNGVLLDEEWVDFLREHKFEVGVSLDGPREIHDRFRKTHEETGSFDSVMKGIRLLQQAEIPFGTLSVVTSESAADPRQLLAFFADQHIFNLNFIPYTTQQDWLDPVVYSEFSTDLFDAWISLNDERMYIRDFANILARIFGRESSLCEYTNCFGNYLGIDTNGDVYMCDLLIGDPRFLLGSALGSTLTDLIQGARYKRLQGAARANHPSCSECPFFMICTGGCMYRRHLGGGLPGRDLYCSARQRLISHILTRLEELDTGVRHVAGVIN